MICRCFGHRLDLSRGRRAVAAALELMAGVPEYEAYVRHQAAAHPDREVESREAFFRAQQARRYGGGGFRCC